MTNAWITGTLFSRVKLIGTYIKADGSNETNYVEADAGKFVSFEIARFFSGLGETVDSRARTDYWRASARAEVNITQQRRPLRRLGREQPRPRRAGADLAASS